MDADTRDGRSRLITVGLIGAVGLTLTWWTLVAAGIWQAIEWAAT